MDISNRPVSAIDRARIAYGEMMRGQREAALQRRERERVRTIRLVVLASALLTMLIGLAAYTGWLPTSLGSSLLAFYNEEDGGFRMTRTGQVRSVVKGDTCRELQFNNERGVYVAGVLLPCETMARRETPPPKGTRINSIRDAFTAR